jgi:hypothetical protein
LSLALRQEEKDEAESMRVCVFVDNVVFGSAKKISDRYFGKATVAENLKALRDDLRYLRRGRGKGSADMKLFEYIAQKAQLIFVKHSGLL